MKLRTKLIIAILLIIVLVPPVERYHNKYEVWQFGNFHYTEYQWEDQTWICFDMMPLPTHEYTFHSLLLHINYEEACNDEHTFYENLLTIIVAPEITPHFIWFTINDKYELVLFMLRHQVIRTGD